VVEVAQQARRAALNAVPRAKRRSTKNRTHPRAHVYVSYVHGETTSVVGQNVGARRFARVCERRGERRELAPPPESGAYARVILFATSTVFGEMPPRSRCMLASPHNGGSVNVREEEVCI